MYLDTRYIAKFYFNEPESPQVRELVRSADIIHSSLWALAEFHSVIHRRLRGGSSTLLHARELSTRFSEHIQDGLWKLIPVNEALPRRTSLPIDSAPAELFLRTADAVHLATACEAGEREVSPHACGRLLFRADWPVCLAGTYRWPLWRRPA